MPNYRHPFKQGVKSIDDYVAYVPPTLGLVEDAERGLDVEFSDAWGPEILSWLAAGKPLVTYCQQEGKPARSKVLLWFTDPDEKYTGLRADIERGLKLYALAAVDDAAVIAEEPLLMGTKGGLDQVAMMDKRQRVDLKLQLAGLLDPNKFAPTQKSVAKTSLTQINVTKNNVVELTDEQLQRVIDEAQRRKEAKVKEAEPTYLPPEKKD